MTLVKICGLMREADVEAAVEAGADFCGFIFAVGSPRELSPERGRALRRLVPTGVEAVGVFTDPARAAAVADDVGLDRVQVYGPTNGVQNAIAATRDEVPADLPDGAPVLLDLAFGSRPDAAALAAHWRRAAALDRPVMLAGSLDPGNVAEAVRTARPWAVDTARGVERAVGEKDHALVRRFVRAAKEAT